MKLLNSHNFVEVFTSDKTFVYPVSSAFSRIDAVDFVLERHKELHPESIVSQVSFTSKASYML